MYQNINFISLDKNELELVLSWRNNPMIKKWMHTKDDISLEAHLDFIKNLKSDKTRDCFLVKKNEEYIGVVNLKDNFLGIYANPDKKKVGDILLAEIIRFAFESKKIEYLKAEVYKNNTSAIKLYKRFGFKIKKDNKVMLSMELNHENR